MITYVFFIDILIILALLCEVFGTGCMCLTEYDLQYNMRSTKIANVLPKSEKLDVMMLYQVINSNFR